MSHINDVCVLLIGSVVDVSLPASVYRALSIPRLMFSTSPGISECAVGPVARLKSTLRVSRPRVTNLLLTMALITPATQLPTELWCIISDSCPRSTQRTLLFVSSRLYDIAVRSVFAHTRLVFGVRRRAVRTTTTHTVENFARSRDDFARSLAILEHFSTCPSFANVVRTLTVRWRDFLESEGENSDAALGMLVTICRIISDHHHPQPPFTSVYRPSHLSKLSAGTAKVPGRPLASQT